MKSEPFLVQARVRMKGTTLCKTDFMLLFLMLIPALQKPYQECEACSSRPCSCSSGGQQTVSSFIWLHRHILFISTEPACPNHHDHKTYLACNLFSFLPSVLAAKWDSRHHLPGLGSCSSFGCLHRALRSFGSKMAPRPAGVLLQCACCK